MKSQRLGRFALKATDGKKDFLGFDTGLGNRIFTGVNLRELRAIPGWHLSDSGAEPWSDSELREIDGSLVFLGPWVPGHCFDPAVDTAPALLGKLAKMLDLLEEKGSPLEVFSPAALYVCDDGSLIIFPPLLVNFTLGQLPVGDQLQLRDPWAHPLFRGAKGRAWSLAALTYRILSGENPFYGRDKAEIHDRIREGEFPRLRDSVPGIKPFVSSFVDAALQESAPDNLPVSEDWDELFRRWKEEGAIQPVDESVRKDFDSRKTRERKRIDRRFGFKRDLSVKGVTWLIIGIIAAALMFLIGTVVVSALKPPLTRGMSRDEVVQAYYQGINNLDYPLVMDCLGSEALDEDAETVKQEHIMAIQRTKQFGDSGIIRAEDWLADGQPPIPPFKILFGLTDFAFVQKDNQTIEASYLRWYTDLSGGMMATNNNINQTVRLTGLRVTDILTLEKRGKDWEISRIDRSVSPHFSREVIWSEGGSIFQE